jgi:hypothetical protein
VIEIPDLGDDFHRMWLELIGLAKSGQAPWALIGAHMVALHGWAQGREQIRPSRDADILVNARAVADGTARMSVALLELGYELEDVSPEGIGHRFVREGVSIDVLGPDGVGERADLQTVQGARTVRVPGGTQALRRKEDVEIRTRTQAGIVPVPNLLGAILVKVRAIEIDDQPEAQRRDVAFLLSLVEDPDAFASEVSQAERKWLRRHLYFSDPVDANYRGIEQAADAAIVYRRLAHIT